MGMRPSLALIYVIAVAGGVAEVAFSVPSVICVSSFALPVAVEELMLALILSTGSRHIPAAVRPFGGWSLSFGLENQSSTYYALSFLVLSSYLFLHTRLLAGGRHYSKRVAGQAE